MSIRRMKKFGIIILIIGIVLLGMDCGEKELANAVKVSKSVDDSQTGNTVITEIPQGNEIKIEIASFESKKATLTILNVSSEIMYIPFLVNKDGGQAALGCEGLQKWDSGKDEFLEFPCSIAGLGYFPLSPGKIANFLIHINEDGIYRVSFKFFKDEAFVKKLNNFDEYSEADKQKMKDDIKSYGKMVLSRNITL